MRLKRLELAKETKVAPFIVFTNTSLNDMVRVLPQTSAEFLTVEGVGKYRLEHYGDAMMAIIKDYLNEKKFKRFAEFIMKAFLFVIVLFHDKVIVKVTLDKH